MTEAEIIDYISSTFPAVQRVEANGTSFFFDGSGHMFPIATLVTTDEHDTASDLNRPGVFRFNVWVGKATFQSLFRPKTADETQYDFTAPDKIMPHPVYGNMYWTCVLNPSRQTSETVKRLLDEAYLKAEKKHA